MPRYRPSHQLAMEQHQQLAALFTQALNAIETATNIVGRTEFTERSLFVRRSIQEWLLDPLIQGYETTRAESGSYTFPLHECPYPSTNYSSRYRPRRPPGNHTITFR